MAGRTAWTAGNGVGFTWTTVFGSADLTSMPSGDVVFSSATAIANQTNLDMLADVSVEITISSTTPSAGAYMALYIAQLNEDGSTYGDGSYTRGTQSTLIPAYLPVQTRFIQSTNATTLLEAYFQGIWLPPNTFIFGLLNETGITFSGTAANNVCKYITYNVNNNN